MHRDALGSPAKFGYEWSNYSEILPEHEWQFLRWICAIDIQELKNKSVVDAGCGNGRNSFWLAKHGVKKIFAFDVSPGAVQVATNNLSRIANCHVSQVSLYDVGALQEFSEANDIVFSIGVIHHLSEPVVALTSLKGLVKQGGKLVIWVYGQEGNERLLRILRPIRSLTSRAPLGLVHLFSKLLAFFLFFSLRILHPKSEYFRLARKWDFSHLTSVIFDQLFPRIANYWTKEEVIGVATLAGWKPIKITAVNGMSWSLLAEKQ
jgi:SAM-dependent methyltransferase